MANCEDRCGGTTPHVQAGLLAELSPVDNSNLDHRGKNKLGWGYAVFGKVVQGMDVMDAIAAVKTGPRGPFPGDVPLETIEIISVQVIAEDAAAEGK